MLGRLKLHERIMKGEEKGGRGEETRERGGEREGERETERTRYSERRIRGGGRERDGGLGEWEDTEGGGEAEYSSRSSRACLEGFRRNMMEKGGHAFGNCGGHFSIKREGQANKQGTKGEKLDNRSQPLQPSCNAPRHVTFTSYHWGACLL